MDKINVFIPAAGLGERLRPITNRIPKPLIPVLGKPALQYVLENISTLPIDKIGINLHHRKELIKEWVSRSSLKEQIMLFEEESILGTGGALKNAEGLLGERTFLVHNSDIMSDIDLCELLEYHTSSKNLVTLAVHDYPKFNCLVIDENGLLKNVGKKIKPAPENAFTGIAVYEPEFLEFLPAGGSSVVDAWMYAVSAGKRVGVCKGGFQTRPYWNDIGTPSAYASVVFDKLRDNGETVYFHSSLKNCKNVELQGHVVIEEGVELPVDVSLENCIVLPGTHVGAFRETPLHCETPLHQNCIIGPDYKIDLNESEILHIDDNGKQLIGTGGSDRKYYRIRKDNKPVVLMQCKSDDPDFRRQIEYTRFFQQHSVPVPELIAVDDDKMEAEFEDAGDMSLYSYLKCPRDGSGIENTYRQVIEALVKIHTIPDEKLSGCELLQKRVFDYEYFRWETSYFFERFVEGLKNINIVNNMELEEELHRLSLKADSYPKTIIHRDFQSQNIMITKGQGLRIIDYQGARIGPPAYDVVSILYDPYYCIENSLRERLIEHYIEQMRTGSELFDETLFRESLPVCSIQRHMQALGAYGFLSSEKAKKYFLKYAPEGLRLLKEDIEAAKDDYPFLHNLIMELS